MSKEAISDFIVVGFYVLTAGIGFFCLKPKLVFQLTILLSLAVCVALFTLKIYIELMGLAHTMPFAFFTWLISRMRLAAKQDRNVL